MGWTHEEDLTNVKVRKQHPICALELWLGELERLWPEVEGRAAIVEVTSIVHLPHKKKAKKRSRTTGIVWVHGIKHGVADYSESGECERMLPLRWPPLVGLCVG
jgi:hypothetical protein